MYFGIVQSCTIDFSKYTTGQYIVFAGDDIIRVISYSSNIGTSTYVSSGDNKCTIDIDGRKANLSLVRASMISMLGMTNRE